MIEHAVAYHSCVENSTVRGRADLVFSLCQDGRLDEARSLLVEDANDPDLLFSNGYVQYWLASTGQGSLEAAKDTLTRAARLFADRGDRDRELLCNVYIGLCYSRQGQTAEARILIAGAAHAADRLTVFLAWLSAAVVELDSENWQTAKSHLAIIQPAVERQSFSLQGRFYIHRALAHELAGEKDAALTDYEQALFCFEQANNRDCAARVYNNLAVLYMPINTETAHLNIDPAITIQRRLKNYPELAQCLDTRALIFLQEGKLTEAKKSISEAIRLLETDHQLSLPRFLITRGRIETESGVIESAKKDFLQAIEIAKLNDNAETVYREVINALCIAAERNFHRLSSSPSHADFRSREITEESELFRGALERAGSTAEAAELIGMPRTTLLTRIKNHHHELIPLTQRKQKRRLSTPRK